MLASIAFLGTLLAQSGELGTSDTMHRLQTTHSFWTSEPPVFPNEYPEFGLIGRNGHLYSWYGMGQSLLMFPPDVAGTYLEHLSIFDQYAGNDPSIRGVFVSFTTNLLIAVLTALVCFRLLLQFEFALKQAAAGVLTLLFATTHLHYSQNMSENNYIFLLTLAGISFQYEWFRTGRKRLLLIGSLALGLNLLTRLTTALDLLAVAGFLAMLLLLERTRFGDVRRQALIYARTTIPVYAAFLLIDRIYQFYRFGSFFNTYLSVFAIQQKKLDPSLPAAYPFEGRFLDGLLGPLFSPEKSIFLFDPLLILSLVATIFLWKRLSSPVKAFSIAAWSLLFGYICFYAKYTVWSGDFAWGDRYVSTAAQIASLLGVPLLLRYRQQIAGWLRWAGWVVVAFSVVVQLASLCFWLPLEIYQMETIGHPTFVIALRFKNIVAFALGKMDPWGLNNHAMTEDPWDYVHITSWNFLPFLLGRVGAAPAWVVNSLKAFWCGGFLVLGGLLLELRRILRAEP
ncbi:hypothetical protein ACPOL_5447 [Acidisarcina polymorpha]|uniref:Glycosyltransferase RgtA/B/C/D-like domain-containing protein n=1 Tax=Acidisarcina polymorpha TaxID=2211140 RepID=A0A2Z5G7Q3_9BACT|nr:hypothetical protein ACPOL_5447 [Acidisarcina polymorpha]